ncbi:gamma-glutamyltransferase [Ferroplasma sp.]|uniref:gamma-glutamyltransferase family protein n=1 Tax=Ferroplasma sp. TaxID=2591003 RepID=UPI00307F6055
MKYNVATSHPLSTMAGLEAMEKGGNAYDAMLAASSALVVVQPHLNGLGGDLFATIKDNKYYCINSSGYAAEMANIDFYSKNDYKEIPKHGPLSSFSIPGLVASWKIASEKSTMGIDENFKRAIQFAKEGFGPSRKLTKAIKNFSYGDDDFNEIYKDTDAWLTQKSLGKTLETLAKEGLGSFYTGCIAEKIDADMKEKGGLIRKKDLIEFKPEILEPVKVNYRGYDIYTNPPVSQGLTASVWLRDLNSYDLAGMEHQQYYDTLIKTMYGAYNIRRNHIYDGVKLPDNINDLKPDGTDPGNSTSNLSDTTAYSIFDGNIEISAIQSNYMGFGSGHSIKGTGINMNNRGSYFTLDRENKNHLEPHKKTFHTLMSILASGKKDIILGSMGGDVQPQVNVQILSRLIDLGANIEDAIAYPRFAYPASIYGTAKVYYESTLRLNHYEPVDDLNDMMGHAQGITVDSEVEAGVDPRGDGLLHYMKEKYFK